MIGDLLLQLGGEPALAQDAGPLVGAMAVSQVNPPLLDAVMRMVRLIDTPRPDAAVLAPLIEREILYRMLLGDQGRAWPRSPGPTAACVRSSGPSAGSPSTSTSPSASRSWRPRRA